MDDTVAARMAVPGIDWRLFSVLTAAGAVASLAVTPLVFTMQADAVEAAGAPLPLLATAQVAQTTVLVALAVLAGLALGPGIGLGAPLLARWVHGVRDRDAATGMLPAALAVGLVGAAVVALLDAIVFLPSIDGLEAAAAPAWQRLLASLYGGITEELLLRLGLFTVLAFAVTRVLGGRGAPPQRAVQWSVNAVVAVAFGLAAAMTAHLTADVVLQLAAGLL